MIYAISGLKRTGKDTVAKFVSELTGAKPYALAHPIKMSLFKSIEKRVRFDLTWGDVNGETDYDREKNLNITTLELQSILKDAVLYNHRENPFSKFELWEIFGLISKLRSSDNMTFGDIVKYSFSKFFFNKQVTSKINKKYEWSIRRLMQTLGTDLVVSVRRDYWLEFISDNNCDIILTDIRQIHEMEYCRKNNAKVIFVVKDGIISSDSHITERGLEPMASDIIIQNNGTLNNLKNHIKEIIKENENARPS